MKLAVGLLTYVTLMGAVAAAQGLGGTGTVQGVVKDSTGGVMVSVTVELSNAVSGFKRSATTDTAGRFTISNVPQNPYRLSVTAQGFKTLQKDLDVRTSVPIEVSLGLELASAAVSVDVRGQSALIEQDPTAHTDIDQNLVARLPLEASSGLSQAITLAAPGVVADSNGFFHPVGDHAQTQFSIDNQPVTDQQSRVYSNQISPDAVQSMEVITGVPPAEFGDKDSLVVRIVTKSGLDQKASGGLSASFGSFKTPTTEWTLGTGSHTIGNFVSASALSTDRFLDPPEFTAIHDHGTSASFFDRLDDRTSNNATFHLNVQAARSSFDVPNTYDQDASGQTQHQKITTFNIAPGYSAVLGSNTVLTANGYVRRDHVNYTPSADMFADTPATMSQTRKLTNGGLKVDVAYLKGAHNLKVGATVGATWLDENFALGITDPAVNSPCVDAFGNPSESTSLTKVSQCAGAHLLANDAFDPGLVALDLSRGGSSFNFSGIGTIKQQAAYIQDEITAGSATFDLGLRLDHYVGLATATLAQPRLGVAYSIKRSGTVFRASYGRTQETPYNENLLVSSSGGANFGAQKQVPLQPGKRDQFEAGVQQAFGNWLVFDVGYFNKHTTNAYDFDLLFDTPIAFPISWDHSRLNGLTGRVNLVEHHGFSAFMVFAHTNAIFSNPENGGLIFDSPLPSGDFRIDHDQKFNQTTNFQYQFNKAHGAWVVLTWRYDSGLVAGAVTDFATAITLSGDQQAAIGLFCGGTVATVGAPITDCASSNRGATRVRIPEDGTEDDVSNPPRIAPRHLVDLGVGVDDLFRTSKNKVKVELSLINLGNTEALYNFLSTFSGTHFVTPRAVRIKFGVTF